MTRALACIQFFDAQVVLHTTCSRLTTSTRLPLIALQSLLVNMLNE